MSFTVHVRAIRARLAACHCLLVPLAAGGNEVSHATVSDLQASALIEMCGTASPYLTSVHRADLAEIVSTIPWHGNGLNSVMRALMVPTKPIKATRRLCQNYESLTSFGTECFWATLVNLATHVEVRLDIIFTLCLQLSLRLPSEKTFKLLAVLIYGDLTAFTKLTHLEKKTYTDWVKERFRARCRSNGTQADSWIDVLPSSPQLLLEHFPLVHAIAFPEGTVAVACPINVATIATATASFACRGHGHEISVPTSTALAMVLPGERAQQQPPMHVGEFGGFLQGLQGLFMAMQGQNGSGLGSIAGLLNGGINGLRLTPPSARQPRCSRGLSSALPYASDFPGDGHTGHPEPESESPSIALSADGANESAGPVINEQLASSLEAMAPANAMDSALLERVSSNEGAWHLEDADGYGDAGDGYGDAGDGYGDADAWYGDAGDGYPKKDPCQKVPYASPCEDALSERSLPERCDRAPLPGTLSMTSTFLDQLDKRNRKAEAERQQSRKRKVDPQPPKVTHADDVNVPPWKANANAPPWRKLSKEDLTPSKSKVPRTNSLDKCNSGAKPAKPSMSHERTRSQYLVRTGKQGRGESSRYTYGEGGIYTSNQLAKRAADAHLARLHANATAGI